MTVQQQIHLVGQKLNDTHIVLGFKMRIFWDYIQPDNKSGIPIILRAAELCLLYEGQRRIPSTHYNDVSALQRGGGEVIEDEEEVSNNDSGSDDEEKSNEQGSRDDS
ncbi:hypothetical protein VNO78_02827 [Psophocarpus tetragonolobus]|uniref:Uncharacterized protein n=1 Tax=Psophocarpus tetragonolobus TaxID=3891 RepID=A0AAN9T016_PSOTE